MALALSLEEDQPYPRLAEKVGLSLGETHNAVRRLTQAGLLSLTGRRPVRSSLLDFLRSGVPYAFPAQMGAETRGVATARSAEPLSREFTSGPSLVWPSSAGSVRGQSIVPLYPGALKLPERNPELYRLLTLVDGIRAGQARERKRAAEILASEILGRPGR